MSLRIITTSSKVNQATQKEQNIIIIEINHIFFSIVYHEDSLLAFGRTDLQKINIDKRDTNVNISLSKIHTFIIEGMNRIVREAKKTTPNHRSEIFSKGITETIEPTSKYTALKLLNEQRKCMLEQLR